MVSNKGNGFESTHADHYIVFNISLQVNEINEVILLGFYQLNEQISRFVDDMKRKYKINIRFVLRNYSETSI